MQSELYGNVVHHGVEVLLPVLCFFSFVQFFAYAKDYGYIRLILELTNTTSLK